MGDFRDSLLMLYPRFRTLSRTKSTSYRQILAAGSDAFSLRIRQNVIDSINQSSDMTVRLLVGEQKNKSWRTAQDFFGDFLFLQDWDEIAQRMLNQAKESPDPRPAFGSAATGEDMPKTLHHYDPTIAAMQSPVVFHRAFQTLSRAIESGFILDADIDWKHGGFLYDGRPCAFAYVDNHGFSFNPQTQIDTRIAIYHPDNPNFRRFFYHTAWKFNDMPSLDPILQSLNDIHSAPLLAWNRSNIEKILFMPGAVAQLAYAVLHQIRLGHTSNLIWPADSELICDPKHELFKNQENTDMLDARGHVVQTISIVQNGQLQTIPASDKTSDRQDNGHAVDDAGNADVLFPVLQGSGNVENFSELTPESYSSTHDGLILGIEKISVMLDPTGQIHIFAPYGGVLCHHGKCLGHTAPPDENIDLGRLIQSGKPASTPVRTGKMGICAIEANG